MKEGWEYKKLKEVGRTQTGTTPSKSIKSFYGGEIPFIRPAELDIDGNGSIEYNSELKLTSEGALKSRTIKANSTLMCCIGSVGKTGYTIKDVTCNQQINTITPYDGYNGKFVYYALLAPSFQKEVIKIANSAKATLAIISKGKWEEMYILVPPLSEQQSIVDYLDSAFAKIDAMKAYAEKALNEAKALFQASLKEILEPKEGWEEKRIDEVCTIARGGSPRPIKDFITNSPEGLNWIKIGDTDMGGKYIYSTKEKIKPEGLKKSRWVEVDEFLLSNSMSFGRPYILKTNGCIHDGWLVLRDYQKYLNIDFFYYVLSSENVQKQFRIKAQGSTVSNLNTDRVASVIIYVPTIERQQSIVATLDSLKSKVDRLQENYDKISQECDALKQAILRQVFE